MPRAIAAAIALTSLLAATPVLQAAAAPRAPAAPAQASADSVRILAVVNGSIITNQDVDARARLFVASSGLPLAPDTIDRLRPQILRQLIDERLRMQEIERQHIVVQDKQIAEAIREVEQRNGMQPGALRARLQAGGVEFTTLIDQVRTEIGWTMLLRQQMGDRLKVTAADVAERQSVLESQIGKPEYHVAEIFISVENPSREADARRFADVVIRQLRAGAPFPVVAAQFSQSQTALQGGDRGWVQPNELDPPVARIVQEMPQGAISEPIPVPGGLAIVQLAGKRLIGRDMATVLTMRQVFLPFSQPLNPNAPTPQQVDTLQRAERISARVSGCADMERAAQEAHSPRPADPGDIRLDQVNPPQFRAMLASQPIGKPTKPIVSSDGIAVMMVCSREEKNLNPINEKRIQEQILETRVELLSRQLQEDLRRRARIEIRADRSQPQA